MQNLYNRKNIDVASINVYFHPEEAKGFECVRYEYYTAYNDGHGLNIEIQPEKGYMVAPRYLLNFAWPENESIVVNDGFFLSVNGNCGKYGLLFDLIFAAGGLHSSNAKVTALLSELQDDYHSQKFTTSYLGEDQVYRAEDVDDYVFDIYYNKCVKTLRIYSIPKQGYIDIALN